MVAGSEPKAHAPLAQNPAVPTNMVAGSEPKAHAPLAQNPAVPTKMVAGSEPKAHAPLAQNPAVPTKTSFGCGAFGAILNLSLTQQGTLRQTNSNKGSRPARKQRDFAQNAQG
jgi:hypothetical protein